MKTYIALSTALLGACTFAHAATDEALCNVVGYHEPHSNIYNGPTECGNISLSTLTVHGPLHLDHTRVQGRTEISGPLLATAARLQDVIIKPQLTATQINLEKFTTVEGQITFEGKAGTVYLQKGSTLSKPVINGTVVEN